MKKAFTLVEMLIVVVVLITLMSIVFRLSNLGANNEARARTISRMQKLENCLSGYYAAFGSYPPVRLHGTRNIYAGVDKWGIQSADEARKERALDDESGDVPMWKQVNAACRSQPVAARYPFDISKSEKRQAIENIANELKKSCQKEGADFKKFRDAQDILINGFDALERPGAEVKDPHAQSWRTTQIFQFGLMSFILPRYAFMTKGSEELYNGNYEQWNGHNETQYRATNGMKYDWDDINRDVYNGKLGHVLSLATQAVCARWMPNLEGIVAGGGKFFGIDTSDKDHGGFVLSANEVPQVFCPTKNPSNQYVLDGCTVLDGWGEEFYYYSPVPFQSYRLWSSGANKKTFPPWIEFSSLNAQDRKTAGEWVSDDIEFMSN